VVRGTSPPAIVSSTPRLLAVVFALALAVAGCGSSAEPTTTTQPPIGGADSPSEALRELLTAVQDGDAEAASTVTIEAQVALLIALDGATAVEARGFLDSGVPEESLALFWDSFRDSYANSFGEDLSDMVVAAGGNVTVDGATFALVDVSLRRSNGETQWITQLMDGRWRVDLYATFASTFAQPLRLWLATLPDDADAAAIREAIAAQRASLLAAVDQQPLGPISDGVASQIKGLIADVGAG